MADLACVAGSGLAVLGVLALRLSWGRSTRSRLFNAAGWIAIAAGLTIGAVIAGAWGVTVVSLWAMGAGFALLAWQGARSPRKAGRASNRRTGMLPETNEPLRIGGRLLTFLLVAVLPLASSIGVALAVRWLSVLAGAQEANANVLALFAAPLAWTILTYALLMTASRRRQFAMILGCAATATPAVLAGGLA